MIEFSITIIIGFSLARYVTESTEIRFRTKNFWLHHWIIATVILAALTFVDPPDWLVGILLGIALEGLPRKNWALNRRPQ